MNRFAIILGLLSAGFFLIMFLQSNPAQAEQRERAEGACLRSAIQQSGYDRRALVIESAREVDAKIQVRGRVRGPTSTRFVCTVAGAESADAQVIRLAFNDTNTR
jgi:hypothetical protein